MAKQYPNNTGQSGIYYSGGGGYFDVDATFNALNGDFRTFAEAASADSWANGDIVEIYARASAGNWVIVSAEWDETNEYLLIDETQDSLGTLSDSDAVEVSQSITGNTLQGLQELAFSGARVSRVLTQQTIPNSSTTTLVWDTADFDTASLWDSGSGFVLPAGYYEATTGFFGSIEQTTSNYLSFMLELEGVRLAGSANYVAGYGPAPVSSGVFYANEGDTLIARLYSKGVALTTHATDPRLFFSVRRVG